ncbi:serine O-acetyltransferase [Marchantia polymorpha subsp. ruderalis]|uniref:serine O-acetyltransferase n=2 Tax=Marchantia polymorpha TaxID=3197 RepID=A0AAF6AKI6_MARPO|nr:hypothetical protein MARPO_0029s0059 [Marchantia polymorpha]BBM96956.1 hypothetical protein Mp_1g01870 [Marchantia polymorpha subsp. ruderalis]|eukprot:PTQ42526.1 hypothetical protein MARPO_0029s0059 [Marchantia polymorpha]
MALLAPSLLRVKVWRPCDGCSSSLFKSSVLQVSTSELFITKHLRRRVGSGGRLRCVRSGPRSGDILEPQNSYPSGNLNEKNGKGNSRDSYEGCTSAPGVKSETAANSIDSYEGDTMNVEASPWKNVFPAYMQSKEDEEESEESVNEPVCNPPSSRGAVNGVVAAKAAAAATASAKEFESQFGSISTPLLTSQSTASAARKNLKDLISHDPIWAAIRAEARLEAEREPLLSSFLYASILAHSCFERSLGFVLANRLKNATLLATQLLDVFDDVFMNDSYVVQAVRLDVQAVKDRDPSCRSYSSALLYLKGYHAIQAYRVAHALWNRGQKVLALALQARISEVFAVDIHPAARIGKSILLDHGTGVVIGETAVVGDRVSMLQGVTLGGTGKASGDRHPKIREGVLIGAGATILGNIVVGKGAMVAAGSLVLKDVPPHSMVAGTPARVVGFLQEPTPSLTMKHDVTKDFCEELEEAVRRQSLLENRLSGGAGI